MLYRLQQLNIIMLTPFNRELKADNIVIGKSDMYYFIL